ncbi:DNA-binding protein [Streptomyces sp. DSM 44915]|uniref:DNA-binding protein n=1 Tax=Streptomyces chisholmiae TaxID=3075540 RepID=A0ABU2JZ55_9ACTN|nr:DNA-binding protein [Streptomyces sp. DSM 44915]MDT0270281.1 DNA-binding protein [Streptomyces sp. DSM 44915]MDT0270293.1 DNA-binding protein [Streptomyces sp. DSM 44915]
MTTAPAMTPAEILALPAVVPVWPTVGRIYGLGRTTTYELARADELPIPVRRVGVAMRARLVDIVADLGLEGGAAGSSHPTTPENDPSHTQR